MTTKTTREDIRTIYSEGDYMIAGGVDEKGHFIVEGPFWKWVYAIMFKGKGEDSYRPYKIYNNKKSKTLKRIRWKLRALRIAYPDYTFKLEEVWQVVPLDDMEKTYYETEEEVQGHIRQRVRGTGMGVRGPGTGEGVQADSAAGKEEGSQGQETGRSDPSL